MALDDAFVSCLNERTERGVIVRATSEGTYELRIAAEIGDDLSVWQHVGTERSPAEHEIVPAR